MVYMSNWNTAEIFKEISPSFCFVKDPSNCKIVVLISLELLSIDTRKKDTKKKLI